MLTMDRIRDAQQVLSSVAERTPVIPTQNLCAAKEVLLKMENLQKTGSFKLRGAYYCISRLSEAQRSQGVIACSAGNHAQGVAYAARESGLKCVICMPSNTPISKVERTRALGAEVVLVPGVYDDAHTRALELQAEHGYTLVHPFDNLDVIAGQGTAGIEMMEQVPDADIVFLPVGGGGLIAGAAFAIKHLNPACQVYGVEALGAPSMKLSVDRGHIQTLQSVATIADGIAVKRVGDETFPLVQQYVDGIVTVKEGEIASAILCLLEDYKVVAEGAGAAAVAAAMYGKVDVRGKKVLCMISGGNVDVNVVAQLIHKGLKKTGRVVAVRTVLDDKPNQLRRLLDVFARMEVNVLFIHHDRDNLNIDVGKCMVDITLETRGHDHAASIIETLEQHGYFPPRQDTALSDF